MDENDPIVFLSASAFDEPVNEEKSEPILLTGNYVEMPAVWQGN